MKLAMWQMGVLCFAVLSALVLTCSTVDAAETVPASPARQRLSLDGGWRFHQGDIPFPVITGHGASYNNAKAGTAQGAAAMDFDDSAWRTVSLPHDWAVETPIDPNANLSQGFHQRGFGWYRRAFKLDRADKGKHISLQFDAVATFCTVWVNGLVVHRNWCGYTGFEIDITPFARYGDDTNTIAVRVDAEAQEGWWYEGAGIYRHTWLVKRQPVHIATDGVFAQPVRDAQGKWSLPVEVTLNSSSNQPEQVAVRFELLDPDGRSVATVESEGVTVEPFKDAVSRPRLTVDNPRLWSVDDPALYTARTRVMRGDQVLDTITTTCGFRTIRFDADKGFFLNDQPLKLKGVCNHQDHAGVGVAVPDSLWEFRLRRLKEMGVNAYRCAHNPPAAEFLDACDRMGILVMDENRNFNTTPEYIRQLQWLVRRDRNHPSVILWSVFNEEPFQGTEMGFEMVRRLVAVVKQMDTTRPVTAAQSGGMLNPINASLAAEVGGFNYRHGEYDRYHAMHPDKPATSSEDTSAVMTRGEYVTDKKTKFVLDSYDTQWQSWGASHRKGWQMIDERPWLAGGFVWTGFDYRGEPQPLVWPATGSSFGIMDQCGFAKSAFYIHQAHWIKDRPVLHVIPHWNWPDRVGKPVKVMGISNADEMDLLVNGKSAGRKPVHKYDMVSWDVPYEAGKLEAVSFKDGKENARFTVETTGEAVGLRLVGDRKSLAGDGDDAQPITVEAVDAEGRVVPTAKPFAKFEVSGPGEIIGVGNGDPLCHEPDKASSRSLFNGLAQVIVQSRPGSTTPITLTATADGLQAGTLTIEVTPAAPRPAVATPPVIQLVRRWRMSQVTDAMPDATQPVSNTDMNTWTNVDAGKLLPLTGGRFAMLRTTLKPRASIRQNGGNLTFNNLTGKATVWIDGKSVARKDDDKPATLNVSLSPNQNERLIVLVLEGAVGTQAGLGGSVTVDEK